uniref:Uncharacterized LOC100187012 n=1 Tax=Ciona intestinalis TaxID=7719 RepID=H2XRE9_CIOIN|nr:uncharacterized protein LOC100187012 [Ciona intestinalis]|eukprot:XP_002130899.1 uncharacterized protein LOC100187012 [Ciona intestinalis]
MLSMKLTLVLVCFCFALANAMSVRQCECTFHDAKDNVLEKIIITCNKQWLTTQRHICVCSEQHKTIKEYFEGKLDCSKARSRTMEEVEVAERAEITGNLKCELQSNSLYEYHCQLA